MSDSIHGDTRVPASADTDAMEWTKSPSGTVWRKRVHRVGPPESGQVTSVVRYAPGAEFPAHDHPDGEEILVLEGVFSDEQGDWPAGTFLLNPEGFRHAPRSGPGCVLFVKLRQYPGPDRRHVALQTRDLEWRPAEDAGVETKPLYAEAGHPESMALERWAPGARPGVRAVPGGVELFTLAGEWTDEHGAHARGSWLRLPPGARHRARTDTGCTLYVKRGGVGELARQSD
ncbi:MAG: cupin domain-containing protein [Myxococcota bacterium]